MGLDWSLPRQLLDQHTPVAMDAFSPGAGLTFGRLIYRQRSQGRGGVRDRRQQRRGHMRLSGNPDQVGARRRVSGAILSIRRPQFAEAAPWMGLMWANMLRAFQVGNARISHDGPSSWMRESRSASAQVSWPACHLTKASASAVM